MLRTSIFFRCLGALLAILIGLYPILYLINGHHYRLLASKDERLLNNLLWNIGFYTHIIFAGIALLIGWLQFNKRLRNRRATAHRLVGKVYIVAALLSGLAGIGIAFRATGGFIPALGFICLGITWIATTGLGLKVIRDGKLLQHQSLMIYSYACCFAAVTLRLWLVVLRIRLPFEIAYPIVAWLSWLPNIAVAWWIVRRTHTRPGQSPSVTF